MNKIATGRSKRHALLKEALKLSRDPHHDRCFCIKCYQKDFPDVIKDKSGHDYIIARGWRRYGVKVPIRAQLYRVFEKWRVLFHGTKPDRIASILAEERFLKPGDTLI